MTKTVATVDGLTPAELVDKLCQFGYRLQCPDTDRVHGFTADGDLTYLAVPEVTAFLVEGNGALLWRGSDDSVYVSQIASKPRIVCDGLTVQQEQSLLRWLSSQGVIYALVPEDAAYEA
jgi:hypothetical protein